MAVVISLLRAVNVGGHNQIKMEALRALYKSLDLRNPSSHIQSGNILFETQEKNLVGLAKRIADAIEKTFGVRTEVILRTTSEMADVIAKNPFAGRPDVAPNKLLITFLVKDPGPDAQENIRRLQTGPEEVHLAGRELYVHFPNGIRDAKLTPIGIDRALKVPGTARNWNTVTKLLELAKQQAV